ncbi:unnamed protein product [Moneuplotes crassus]|uniref:MORN repeat-containing protein n=1 Tax=Euplotes crassus TaxID=5936 RepID=A0AAD1X7W3_EUPCR|nr:unnamed protein product [Moneuplotes crassus]
MCLFKSENTKQFGVFDLKSLSDISEQDEVVDGINEQLGDFQFIDDTPENEQNREYTVRLNLGNGYSYTGQVLKATKVMDGKGVIKYPDLSVFSGHFKNNCAAGLGRLILSTGDVYEGEWAEAHHPPDDSPFMILKSWPHGEATFIKLNGDHYSGEWSKGMKCGYGKQAFQDGSEYNGYYENDMMNGGGILRSPDGQTYNGNFVNGVKEGDGCCEWPDGRIYEGEWHFEFFTDLKNHLFKMNLGEWKDNKMHGKGLLIEADGTKVEGRWDKGQFCSDGTKVELNQESEEPKLPCLEEAQIENKLTQFSIKLTLNRSFNRRQGLSDISLISFIAFCNLPASSSSLLGCKSSLTGPCFSMSLSSLSIVFENTSFAFTSWS